MGVLGKAHGLKGEIQVSWEGEFSPEAGLPVLLNKGSVERNLLIKGVRKRNDKFILTISGVDNRTAAEELTGARVYVAKSSLPKLAEDESWLADLVECDVYLPDGSYIGALHHVEFPAGNEVWDIRQKDHGDVLFPARPEFIVDINTAAKRVTIDPPPGLLDIYRA